MTLRAAALVLLATWAAAFACGLGGPEIKGEEWRRVLPARTMLDTGEFVVPFVEGKPYARKPPLINWAVAGSFAVFGVQNEWTARLPSALCVLALAAAVLAASARWLSPGYAFLAALFSVTSLAVLEKGRLAEIEAIYVPIFGIAFALWSRFWILNSSRWLLFLVPWTVLGVGILAKGPLHVAMFYAIAIWTMAAAGRLRDLVSLPHFAGVCLMAAPAAVWGVLFRRRTAAMAGESAAPADDVWIRQLTSRLDPTDIDWAASVVTPFEAAANFLPWLALGIAAGILLRRRRSGMEPPPPRLAAWHSGAGWGTLAGFLAVTLIPGAQARFAHPLFVPAALLVASWLRELNGTPAAEPIRTWWNRCNQFSAVVIAVAAVALPVVAAFVIDFRWSWLIAGAGVLMIALAAARARRLAAGWPALPRCGAASAAVIAGAGILFGAIAHPLIATKDDVRPVGRRIAAAIPAGARLCVFQPDYQPFLFYLDPGYTVAARSSRIPVDTTHVLATENAVAKNRAAGPFRAFNFTPIASFTDERNRSVLLLEARQQPVR